MSGYIPHNLVPYRSLSIAHAARAISCQNQSHVGAVIVLVIRIIRAYSTSKN